MSKRLICNGCHAEVIPGASGLAPNGWLYVSERGNYKEDSEDYCSRLCAANHFLAIEAAKAIIPVVEPEPVLEEVSL